MEMNELVSYYSQVTDNINSVSNDIVSFADEVNDTLMENFSVPEPDDDINWYEHFSNTLEELKTLPDLDIDIPDFQASQDFQFLTSQVFDLINSLFTQISSYLPEIPSILPKDLGDIPEYSFDLSYPSQETPAVEELPNSPQPSIPVIPSIPEISPDKTTYSAKEYLDFITQCTQQVIDTLSQIDENLDIEHDLDLGIRQFDIRTVEDWKADTYDFLLPYQNEIDLDLIYQVVTGERLDSYVFSEEFIKSLADFSEKVVRTAPVTHLKTIELEQELDRIASNAVARGFSDDVIDGSLYFDISLHKAKAKLEQSDVKSKVLSHYNTRIWKMVEDKTSLYNKLSSSLLLSYFSLVDMVTRLYQFELGRVEKNLNLIEKAIQLKTQRVKTLINQATAIFSSVQANIKQLTNASLVQLDNEIFASQSLILSLTNIRQNLLSFIRKLNTIATKLRQDSLTLTLHRIKSFLLQQKLRFESIKNEQVIIENRNNLLSSLRDLVDMDLLQSKFNFINQTQRAKLQILKMYLNYINTVLRKQTLTPELDRQLRNLRAELEKYITQAQGEQTIKSIWLSTLNERAEVNSYDYRLLMRKILYDTERAVDLALTHLHDRISKESTKYETLGEYYSKQIRGVLSSAHTIVSLTDRTVEAGS